MLWLLPALGDAAAKMLRHFHQRRTPETGQQSTMHRAWRQRHQHASSGRTSPSADDFLQTSCNICERSDVHGSQANGACPLHVFQGVVEKHEPRQCDPDGVRNGVKCLRLRLKFSGSLCKRD